jgi:hypothetical protein
MCETAVSFVVMYRVFLVQKADEVFLDKSTAKACWVSNVFQLVRSARVRVELLWVAWCILRR